MSPLEIVLIVLGIIIIFLSFSLAERFEEFLNSKSDQPPIHNILSNVSDATLSKTEEALDKISNEKILAIHEFSEQLFEKIEKNHEEVIFLYHMLNEKEKELHLYKTQLDKNSIPTNLEEKQSSMVTPSTVTKSHGEQLEYGNHNKKILDLYKKGMSVIDISKKLELGQGEVKLVIDLFQDKRK